MRSNTSVVRAPVAGIGRSLLRLAPAAALAAGALLGASQLAHDGTSTPPASVVVGGGTGLALTQPVPKLVGYDPRVTAPDAQHALAATLPAPVTGLADLANGDRLPSGPVDRAVPGRKHLGPLHTDPLPPGVTLAAPTDTASLYARSGAVPMTERQLAAATAASAIPPGTPNTTGLSQHVAPSCTGTGADGKRVQALYVHEASKASRYSSVLSLLRDEVANVDDVFAVSSRKTGGDLRVRWVHDADCVPVIPDLTVPDGSLAGFNTTIDAVRALGYADRNRKYLMFADANRLCGVGTLYDVDTPTNNPNDGYAASYSRIDANCWSTGESVAAHELTHNLGGVLGNAPHATTNGHCWDESDLMCYDDGSGIAMRSVCPSSQSDLLDCNGDDYFSTAPPAGGFLATHWNTARSGFLEPAPDTGGEPSGGGTAPAATAWSPVGRSGSWPVRLSATLRDAVTGAPLAGRPVELQVRPRGSDTWLTSVTGLTTDGTGRVLATPDVSRAGWFRFVTPAGTEYAGSGSGSTYLKVPTRLTLSLRPARHLVLGRLTTVDGSPLASARVTLLRRYPGSAHWAAVATRVTDRHGVARVRLSARRDAYLRWSFPGEVVHGDAVSGRRLLRG